MAGLEAAIQLIVEGPGDFGAVPVLLRKMLHEAEDFRPNMLGQPIAAHGLGNVTKSGGIEGFIRIAAARPGTRLIVVILDADDECIKERAEALLPRCGARVPVLLALAERNFEDWIYASAETTLPGLGYTTGKSGLGQIKSHRTYTKSLDQAKLAAAIDLDMAAPRSPSLTRLRQRFESHRSSI